MSLSPTVLSRWMRVQLDKRGVQHLCGDHIWHLSIIWGQASYDRRRSPAGQKDVLRRIRPVWFGHCNDAVQGEWCPVVCDGPRLWRVCDDIGTQSRPGSVSPNSYTMRTAVSLVLNLTLSNSLIMCGWVAWWGSSLSVTHTRTLCGSLEGPQNPKPWQSDLLHQLGQLGILGPANKSEYTHTHTHTHAQLL